MNILRIILIILAGLTPLIELVFSGSGIDSLINLRIILAVAICLIAAGRTKSAIFLLLLGTSFVEIYSHQDFTGITSLAFLLAVFAVNILSRFSSFLSEEGIFLKGLLVLILSLGLRHIFLLILGLESAQLQPVVIILNVMLYGILMVITQRLITQRNAFKR